MTLLEFMKKIDGLKPDNAEYAASAEVQIITMEKEFGVCHVEFQHAPNGALLFTIHTDEPGE